MIHVERSSNQFKNICNKPLHNGDGASIYWNKSNCIDCLEIGKKEGNLKPGFRLDALRAEYTINMHASRGSNTTWCGDTSKYSGNFEFINCESCMQIIIDSGQFGDQPKHRLDDIIIIRDKLGLRIKNRNNIITGRRIIPSRPHKCPQCGGAAYVGFATTLDCERGCK